MVATLSTSRPVTVPPAFQRTPFATSRLLEFFTEKELGMQLGVGRAQWSLALLKELIDNALDACESAGTPPTIIIALTPDTLTVTDNGPGLPSATLQGSLDYLIRVSDKAYYVSPTRGQLGNALKGVWAAPFVVDGREGRVTVQTAAYAYDLCVQLDRIAQHPRLTLRPRPDAIIQSGTMITLYWPGIATAMPSLTPTPHSWTCGPVSHLWSFPRQPPDGRNGAPRHARRPIGIRSASCAIS